MAKLDDAKKILTAIKMPVRQQSDMCCYVLLAMCNIELPPIKTHK